MYLQPQFSGKSKYLICFFMHTFTQKSLRCALPSKVVTLFLEQMFMLKSQTNKPPQTNKTNHSKWNPKPSIPKFLLFFSPLYLTSHTSYLNGILYAPPPCFTCPFSLLKISHAVQERTFVGHPATFKLLIPNMSSAFDSNPYMQFGHVVRTDSLLANKAFCFSIFYPYSTSA